MLRGVVQETSDFLEHGKPSGIYFNSSVGVGHDFFNFDFQHLPVFHAARMPLLELAPFELCVKSSAISDGVMCCRKKHDGKGGGVGWDDVNLIALRAAVDGFGVGIGSPKV